MNDTNNKQHDSENSHTNDATYLQITVASEEEEQIVTSTSSNIQHRAILLSASQERRLNAALVVSPACISSSTGNDYNPTLLLATSSPQLEQRVAPLQKGITQICDHDSQSESLHIDLENRQLAAVSDGAMPTTSAAAVALAADSNNCTVETTTITTTTATKNTSINNIRNNGKLEYISQNCTAMVARDILPATVADSGGGSAGNASSSNVSDKPSSVTSQRVENIASSSENHKIILKIPKSLATVPPTSSNSREESHMDVDPTTSSCSNSSSSNHSSFPPVEDTRKVEPLKINLHHAHAPNLVVPKITIKPIVKTQNDATSDCSSSAEDDVRPIPKLTIKSTTAMVADGNCSNIEPHIVPKLTIRSSGNEEGGSSSVVPKLTIKMSDAQSVNSLLSPATVSMTLLKATTTDQSPPPPLPKLTIKTSLDGTSESIISTVSPASSSSSCSMSSGVSASLVAYSTSTTSTSCITSTMTQIATVPKLTIKTVQKPHDEIVPKLTIKTNATGACVSTSSEDIATTESSNTDDLSLAIKIPKLTIKTGQEHAVIITQHNDTSNTQAIPKLTIKTKSIDIEERSLINRNDDQPPEKIPKITIKTNETPAAETPTFCIKNTTPTVSESDVLPHIPKLTISVSNLEGLTSTASPQSPKQSPLVVRQLAALPRKPESPERVPKLMISRQDSLVTNHCEINNSEKTVPKLTIKTNSTEAQHCSNEIKDKTAMFAIKSNLTHSQEEDKIPKLTIKPIPPKATQLQSSEDSDECLSIESSSSPVQELEHANKVVPKLTIKNLSSPKLKIKAVLEDQTASKKCVKSSDAKGVNNTNATLDVTQALNTPSEAANKERHEELINSETVANGGESSNSQEFCGFNDNTTDSAIDTGCIVGTEGDSDELEEPRRNSDDMEIDEGLQQHDPQIFNNVTCFGGTSNGGDSFASMAFETDVGILQPTAKQQPRISHVIDTVDLTSSPSPGSSPAHFNYTDADPQIPTEQQIRHQPPSSALLIEHLQRETSVIQTVLPIVPPTTMENTSFLLSQLTAPLDARAKHHVSVPPPLQPKPNSNSIKYPQLAERLMANGLHVSSIGSFNSALASNEPTKPETVIDSIEILDTPEGSVRSSLDDMPAELEAVNNHQISNHVKDVAKYINEEEEHDNSVDVLRRNNNKMDQPAAKLNHINMKRHATSNSLMVNESSEISPNKLRRIENNSHTMATLTILTNDQSPNATIITTSPIIATTNHHCVDDDVLAAAANTIISPKQLQHRSRKQRHEHLLSIPIDEEDPLNVNSSDITEVSNTVHSYGDSIEPAAAAETSIQPLVKKRGRPKKIQKANTTLSDAVVDSTSNDTTAYSSEQQEKPTSKTRLTRVQLLRKRLAIDMVASEQLTAAVEAAIENNEEQFGVEDLEATVTHKRDRALRTPMRTSRRSNTPYAAVVAEQSTKKNSISESTIFKSRKRLNITSATDVISSGILSASGLNNFGGSNSSISSACSSSSLSSTTITTTAAGGNVVSLSMATQIDLTMSSSSSSASNGSTTATVTTAQSRANSMLPPTTILSSSDPVPDVIFKPNDFSSIMATQQLRSPRTSMDTNFLHNTPPSPNRKGSRPNSQDEEGSGTGGEYSGDDSASSSSFPTTPGRGRGRGRGRSRGSGAGSARGPRAHRLGRGASAVAKQIAMSRPRCVGGLKHTPDPHRIKGLFNPSPQVFEEDTRMSADLNISQLQPPEPPHTPLRQPDFLTNEESQSSIVSNTSILDPITMVAVQNGSTSKQRPKKKKMEVCVAEDTEITVAAIAEYDWPPPKGCCPSKNRDTFMIQEQVALYLGIKSFKRKYPDLPRRQIDMEERNWLQEKGLVSEKMCDLGITGVWASDILDIMYTDFYEKYEEYKDFIRQKHLRDIEAKHKALGLNVITGRGLQARDRAMISATKWNAYFNKSRKEERLFCVDLQTLTVNVPLSADAPSTTRVNRSIAEAVTSAALAESIPEPPTLLQPRRTEQQPLRLQTAYPLALVPGQYCAEYRHYSPLELRTYPLNTVLDNPRTLHERLSQCLVNTGSSDTDSAEETIVENPNKTDPVTTSSTKRLPVRRSRRARTNAAAERTKTKCDTKSADENYNASENTLEDKKAALLSANAKDSSSTETSSSSGDSSSETDTESDSSCTSSSSSDEDNDKPPAVCGVCQRSQHLNLKEFPEVFIKCYSCRRKVHPSCIEMPHRMATRVRNYNWQCVDCKCCIKCKRTQDQNKMLFCEQCDRGFHIYCLDVKAVPDGRWSCERCSICIRCGATKPEGMPLQQHLITTPNGEKIKQIKHKKVKWINEYRIDHITKLREHCSMLCVPCGRTRTAKRVQIANNNTGGSFSPGSSAANLLSPPLPQQNKQHVSYTQMSPPSAPISTNSSSVVVAGTATSLPPPPPPPVVA